MALDRSPNATPTTWRVCRSIASQIQTTFAFVPTNDQSSSSSRIGRSADGRIVSAIGRKTFFQPCDNRRAAHSTHPRDTTLRDPFMMQLLDQYYLLSTFASCCIRGRIHATITTVVLLATTWRTSIQFDVDTATLFACHGKHSALRSLYGPVPVPMNVAHSMPPAVSF